jgi:hypothetical protein
MKETAASEDFSRIIVICPNAFRLVENPEFRMCFESSGHSVAETLPQNNPPMGHDLSVA